MDMLGLFVMQGEPLVVSLLFLNAIIFVNKNIYYRYINMICIIFDFKKLYNLIAVLHYNAY